MPISPKHRQQSTPSVDRRETATQRGYDSDWRRLRAEILERYGFRCNRCGIYGNYSYHVDHIKPFDGVDDPKRLDENNLQVLCPSCHSIKTVKEDGLKSQRNG
jgi:5-methylcytosine-specific restriction protein A